MIRNTTIALEPLENTLLNDSAYSIWNIKPQFFTLTQRFFTRLKSLENTFKIISVLFFMLLTSFLVKPDVALAGGFDKTCSNIKLNRDKTCVYLSATCLKNNGQKADSRLDISKYIANRNGNLVWAPREGGFIKSCVSAIYLNDGTFQADYCKGDPQPYASIFDLKPHISNQDGVLTPDL
jgi:CVNH domain